MGYIGALNDKSPVSMSPFMTIIRHVPEHYPLFILAESETPVPSPKCAPGSE
jgi:hypothetical protein